jgi:hypothetical protein
MRIRRGIASVVGHFTPDRRGYCTFPDTVLAYRAVGKIEKDDYETVLSPVVEAMIAENGEVRFVYVLGDEFDAYTTGATLGRLEARTTPCNEVDQDRRRYESRLGPAHGRNVRLDGAGRG